VKVRWRDTPLQNQRGEQINFSASVLHPQARLSKTLGVTHKVLEKSQRAVVKGEIEYKDAGTNRVIPFKVDFGEYDGVPLFDQEDLNTHYRLQQIPEELAELNRNVERIRKTLEGREIQPDASKSA
jgi:hypothetical protein